MNFWKFAGEHWFITWVLHGSFWIALQTVARVALNKPLQLGNGQPPGKIDNSDPADLDENFY